MFGWPRPSNSSSTTPTRSSSASCWPSSSACPCPPFPCSWPRGRWPAWARSARGRRLGFTVVGLVGGLIALWLIWKCLQRQRFMREISMDRISPGDLQRKLEAGEPIAIVDLRHRLDFDADPRTLPGALRLDAAELEQRHQEIPRDRAVVLYGT